ncbi:MAG: CRISPR-associated endonuclease Cas3'' [Pseudomonadota bacterium]
MKTRFFAHSKEGRPESEWQPLRDHLQQVARLCRQFAEEARPGDGEFSDVAYRAGLLHDIGKYTDEFQQLLMASARGQPKTRVEHSGQGARLSFDARLYDLALVVAGHHAGLGSPSDLKERLARHARAACDLVLARAREEVDFQTAFLLAASSAIEKAPANRLESDLHIRMLFSCLVDADRLDAARMEKQASCFQDAGRRFTRLLDYITDKAAAPVPEGAVKTVRGQVLKACLAAAEGEDRLLSLTVPTGGGKTLSSMAFALKRIMERPSEARRVIVVIPFLSIIEQNAEVYAEAVGRDILLQHHSGEFGGIVATKPGENERWQEQPDREEADTSLNAFGRSLAVENWDAPIVVTTSVRFFESLFSNRPSDLRRLHNVARSIVILDEVQTLPRNFIEPLLSMVGDLAENWGTTFLFCTATQPAFEKPPDAPEKDRRWPRGRIREIMPGTKYLFRELQRVRVTWPDPDREGRSSRCSWEEVGDWMAAEPRALCVVNLKSHAGEVFRLLRQQPGIEAQALWHLSTRMCPRHRLDALAKIKGALDGGETCRVVSTQLVEAGVDLDFPVVFRAMGPLDSIAQAAGRCDREGRLTAIAGAPAGRVVVFEPDVPENQSTPPGAYADATGITRLMAGGASLDIHDPAHIRGFFNRYYQTDLDPEDINALRKKLEFREVAERFAMIDDRTKSVLVPYNEEAKAILAEFSKNRALTLGFYRRMQRYTIGLYPGEFSQAQRNGAIYELVKDRDIWACDARFYSSELGFVVESEEPLIV